MTTSLTPLTQLTENDLIWIDLFAQALREHDSFFAQPEGGRDADHLARNACDEPGLRELGPREAALRWLAR